MQNISSRPVSTRPLTTELRESPQAQASSSGAKIGSHSVDALMQRVTKRLDQDMENTFTELRQDGMVSRRMNKANACMIATLQAANGALKDAGIHLSPHQAIPAGVEELVKRTAVLTRDNLANRLRIRAGDLDHDATGSSASVPGFEPEHIALHLDEIERLQSRLSNNPFSPFVYIQPHQRWRMCIDPDKVSFVETHVTGARDNPLLPFMFDSTPGYLHGVLEGWQNSMTNLKSRIDASLICGLHRACFQSDRPYERQTFSCQFMLHEGANMTPDGARQLKAFAKELRKTLPEYAVVKSDKAYKQFVEARKTQPDAQPDDSFTDSALLVHPEVPFSVVRTQMGVFVNAYNEQVSKTPKASPRQRQAQAIELCQKLEQLHPFPDANARTFGILLLNHLLAREKLPLTMLEDPNILDGWSTAEVAQELEKGQARAAGWTAAGAGKQAQSSSKTNLGALNNLGKLFKKKP